MPNSHSTTDFQTIGVVGLGYVGIPLMIAIARNGMHAVGFDIEDERVEAINQGKSYLKTISDEQIGSHVDAGNLSATAEFSELSKCDAILICVPTPLNSNREPVLTYVEESARVVARNISAKQLIVLESTTYPGTTEELIKPILESSGLKCGDDFFLAYSPEREDPGNIDFSTSTIPKLVGGVDEKSTHLAVEMYQKFIEEVVTVSSARVAEAAKLYENIFRTVNIGLVNELKMVLDPMDINMWEVVDAAKTKPFGFLPFYPGPGWGGHCIPVDPVYLNWKAREFGKSSSFIEHASDINNRMTDYVINKTAHAIDMEHGKGLRDAKVLMIGIAYKSNVDDMRESPAVPIFKAFRKRRSQVSYYDPLVATFSLNDGEHYESVEPTAELLQSFDVALICTNHDGIDWQFIVDNCQVVVDTRNATKDVQHNRDRIHFA